MTYKYLRTPAQQRAMWATIKKRKVDAKLWKVQCKKSRESFKQYMKSEYYKIQQQRIKESRDKLKENYERKEGNIVIGRCYGLQVRSDGGLSTRLSLKERKRILFNLERAIQRKSKKYIPLNQ
jgi:hypothetical protein